MRPGGVRAGGNRLTPSCGALGRSFSRCGYLGVAVLDDPCVEAGDAPVEALLQVGEALQHLVQPCEQFRVAVGLGFGPPGLDLHDAGGQPLLGGRTTLSDAVLVLALLLVGELGAVAAAAAPGAGVLGGVGEGGYAQLADEDDAGESDQVVALHWWFLPWGMASWWTTDVREL